MACVAFVGVMAVGAAYGAVAGETSVKIELTSQFDLSACHWVVGRERDLFGPRCQTEGEYYLKWTMVFAVLQYGCRRRSSVVSFFLT